MATFRENPGAMRRLLTSPAMVAEVTKRADAIRDACNAQSSWGGYESGAESHNRKRASANVWTIDMRATADEARTNRMLRNLGAGR